MTDIDDTLTADGRLDSPAATALQALRDAGVPVIAITGRPLGWSRELTADWPLVALVAENGGAALVPTPAGRLVEYAQDDATRATNSERLRATLALIQRELPQARPARDSAGRETDIAIDHGEFERLDEDSIAHVVALMRGQGLRATVSSIHVNGWIGTHDKLSGARWMVRYLWGRDLDAEIDRWVYVGDSTNDQVMFAAFPLSVGVANLRRFADRLQTWPAYITDGERGAGFAEVARRLLAARGAA